MRAARAGPVLRGQCFANEQILRGPTLAARKGPVQACLQGNHEDSALSSPAILEVLPPSSALPVMVVAILSVWAAHCAPETSPVHESVSKVSSVYVMSLPQRPLLSMSLPQRSLLSLSQLQSLLKSLSLLQCLQRWQRTLQNLQRWHQPLNSQSALLWLCSRTPCLFCHSQVVCPCLCSTMDSCSADTTLPSCSVSSAMPSCSVSSTMLL